MIFITTELENNTEPTFFLQYVHKSNNAEANIVFRSFLLFFCLNYVMYLVSNVSSTTPLTVSCPCFALCYLEICCFSSQPNVAIIKGSFSKYDYKDKLIYCSVSHSKRLGIVWDLTARVKNAPRGHLRLQSYCVLSLLVYPSFKKTMQQLTCLGFSV